VTNEVKERIKEGAFPFEYHAQVLGEHIERSAALGSLYSYLIAAAVVIVLLLQAALGSWRRASLVIIGMPVAAFGGFISAYLGGGVLSLGSFIGIAAILFLAVRNGIVLIRQIQALEPREAAAGADPVLQAAEGRFRPIVATAIATGLITLPFVALGDIAGLEILHPAGVAMLGCLVTSTILTLFVTPALYTSFAAKAAEEKRPLAPEVA
jgi:multidrug efflux pump subunit AcrB